MHLQATRTPLLHVEGDVIIHAHLHDLRLEKFGVTRLFPSKKKNRSTERQNSTLGNFNYAFTLKVKKPWTI